MRVSCPNSAKVDKLRPVRRPTCAYVTELCKAEILLTTLATTLHGLRNMSGLATLGPDLSTCWFMLVRCHRM